MNQNYKHKGQSLNKTIIRDILYNKLQLPMTWLSVKEFEERIKQYHQQNGGKPPEIVDHNSPVYGVLQELIRDGKLERKKEDGKTYYRSVLRDDPIQKLLIVIKEEYDRLDSEIASLESRKAQLEEILSEHGN